VQPNSAVQSTANNKIGQSVVNNEIALNNTETSQNSIISRNPQSMGTSTGQFQSISGANSFFDDVQVLNFHSFSLASSSNDNPSISIKQSNLNM
jgi:hypothetical protein